MKKIAFLFLLISTVGFSQVTITPTPFSVSQSITITVDANSNATDSNGFSNPTKVYLHSGVGTTVNPWTHVIGNWGQDDGVGEMTSNGDGTWSITLTPETYYGLTSTQAATITKMGMVFRNEDGSQEFKDNGGTDFFFDVGLFQVTLTSPSENITSLTAGQSLSIAATSTQTADFVLKANGTTINTTNNITSFSFSHIVNENTDYILEVTNAGETNTNTFHAIVSSTEQPVPAGMKDGINLDANDATKATLVLYAPNKNYVHLIGDFNNWQVSNTYLLNKDSTNDRFWIELTGLTSQTNHMYQYVVDGEITIADPYSTTILDEHEDFYINNTTYPNLPTYPTGKTNHAVTLLRTGDTPFVWQTQNFQKPAKTDLVIYELLIRDFDELHSFDAVKARLDYLQALGVNAIELMPVSEFNGNISWGYNPNFHMALDKYYGSPSAFKELVDECHARGIAVFVDVVYNQAEWQNPFYRLWTSGSNPFFNATATHAYNVFNDFNHSYQGTKDYVKRTVQYWIEEYKIDGMRWDLTKGFTQNCAGNINNCTDIYQQDRVDILKEYADYQWEVDADFIVIFEHLGDNTEEAEWVNYRLNEGKGILMWSNLNGKYNEGTMGFNESGKSDFSWMSYKNRGWTVPANIGYMESHDEERLMYKNLTFATPGGTYDITNLNTALERQKLAGAFYFTIPGPKMIWQFGEVGYDFSIFYDKNSGTVPQPYGTDTYKTDPKPIRWDYFDNPSRKSIYNTWADLILLKKNYGVFRTDNFTLNVGNANGLKTIHLTDDAASPEIKHITVIGNFGVVAQDINPAFQQTGTWYDLLNNNATITVSNVNSLITLQPGEFKVYGTGQATLSLDDQFTNSEKLLIYPNPIEHHFQINVASTNVSVYDLLGRKVSEFKGNFKENHVFTIPNVESGIYFVKVTGKHGAAMQKIIKK